ncbi:MAG: tetratricopeptide (TPR) repeat protein [Kiritimatiellia bacterium]|jgi:tetratricopeptide (TPR) repeat protein
MMDPTRIDELRAALRSGLWLQVRDEARELVDTDDDGQICAVLSQAYQRLGLPQEASQAADQAARIGDHWSVQLALGEAALGQGRPELARSLLEDATDPIGPDNKGWHELTLALAVVLRAAGEAEHGYGLAQRALVEAELAKEEQSINESLIVVGHCAYGCALPNEAEGAFSRALELRQAQGEAEVLLAEAYDGLGMCARAQGRPFDAVAYHRKALERWTSSLAEDSGPVSACRHRLAQALHRTGDFPAARDEMARSLLLTARTLGTDHVDTWITRFEMARYDVDCGDLDGTFQRMADARAEVARRLGAQHPVVRSMDRFL